MTGLAASPDGLVAAHLAGRDLVVSALGGARRGVHARSFVGIAMPDEIALASGPQVDVIVTSRRVAARDDALELAAVPRRGTPGAVVALARSAHGGFEAHVAGGSTGFLVVWSAPPHFGELRALRLDASGSPASPEHVLAKVERPGAVLRFPRVAPLGAGWAVGVWTGLGVGVVRVTAGGEASAPPFDVPAGDSAAGLTEVWPAQTSRGLALTWMPRRPFGGMVETETPPRGARLALLACEAGPR